MPFGEIPKPKINYDVKTCLCCKTTQLNVSIFFTRLWSTGNDYNGH